jgi:hypothetical protein
MCDAYDMCYHKQETKHKEVCVLSGAKLVRPVLETGQTAFTQSCHKIGKTQKQTHSSDKQSTQTNIKSLRNI